MADDQKTVVTDSEISGSESGFDILDKVKPATKALAFLEKSMSNTAFGMAATIAGSFLFGTNAVTGVGRYFSREAIAYASSEIADWLSPGKDTFAKDKTNFAGKAQMYIEAFAEVANSLFDELKDPNVGGIPIHSDNEVEAQDVEVNQNLVIVEEAGKKDYVVDNAVPKLKTWQVRGYLMSNPRYAPVSGALVIKPDLLLQRKILDMYLNSRKPVIFKTHDNRFYKVQITHMDTAYSVQGTNGLGINITLQEYKIMEVQDATLGVTAFEKVKEEVAS